MTLEFEGDFLPRGQVETVFMENAEREPGVVAVAEQVGPPRGRRGSRCRTRAPGTGRTITRPSDRTGAYHQAGARPRCRRYGRCPPARLAVTEGDPARQGSRHFVASVPDDARAYFAERHQRGERLDLLAVEVAATGPVISHS